MSYIIYSIVDLRYTVTSGQNNSTILENFLCGCSVGDVMNNHSFYNDKENVFRSAKTINFHPS